MAKLFLTFDVESMYLLDGGDQADWNKGGGLAPLFTLRGMDNKAMVVWRWWPPEQRFHVGLYWHPRGGGRVMPEDNGTLLRVPPGHMVVATFMAWRGEPYHGHVLAAGIGESDVVCEGTRAPLIVRNVFSYFGGNRTAPRRLRYDAMRLYYGTKIKIKL